MPRRSFGPRRGGPWYGTESERVAFEREAWVHYPDLTAATLSTSKIGRRYTVTLDVWHYLPQKVRIDFRPFSKRARVFPVEGPVEWRHRNGDGSLCLWYEDDPPEQKWGWEDGLGRLLVLVQFHLFREEWFREYGAWLGPEVHGPPEG